MFNHLGSFLRLGGGSESGSLLRKINKKEMMI